ncbi:MAG: ABC transporter permease [Oscillospiraceae bacterium]|nr:ABC transporter permease [Oscillospiraceae bacterium]
MDTKKKLAKPGSLHLSADDVTAATDEQKKQLFVMRESVTYWKDAFRRFRRNKIAMASLVVIVLIFAFAYIGPFFSPYSYDQQIRGSENLKPCFEHPFGTDRIGRDMLVRNMIGARISLTIGVFCALLVVVIGTIYGSVSGYAGGAVDNVMMRLLEILYSVPDILVIIILQIALKAPLSNMFPNSRLGSSVFSIFIAFALLYWVNMGRMVRGQVLFLKQMEYVTAARAMGARAAHIIRKHLIPNCVGVIMVTAVFQIAMAIFVESFLSYIGLGVSAPMASLGSLCSDALPGIKSYPHLLFIPAILISLIILSFNMVGDGLRDALDPRLRS